MPRVEAALAGALPAVRALLAAVGAPLADGEAFRYKHLWQSQVRELTTLLALLHWLRANELLPLARIAALLGLRAEADGSAIALELEDYLYGVACVPSELERLAINCVTRGDFDSPARIARFVKQLYAAFQRLNMKNDFLRRKYDSIKYSVNKVESVLFDLKIRGLVKTDAPQTTLAPTEQ